MTDQMRDEFEVAIALETGRPVQEFRDDRQGESYASTGPKYAWWGWKTSLEAMPDHQAFTIRDEAGTAFLACQPTYSCVVKVKP